MMLTVYQFISIALILLRIQYVVALSDIYEMSSGEAVFRSKITGKPFDMTPHYEATGINNLRANKYKGEGVRVGIIGGGIVYDHKVFLESKFLSGKMDGYGFVHRRFTGTNQVYPSTDFEDFHNGHGTEMAGIIGGNSEQYKGIAPQALLGIYRVFGEVGRTSTSIVLKALTLAIEEKKMKIITLPEIGVIDSNEENLRRKIKQASQNNVIMVAAATPNNYVNPKYFSYAGLPVLSVGGINLPYDMGHWFTHMSTGTKLLFTTTCRYMSYTFDDIDLVIASPLRPHNAITFDKPVNGKVILLPPYNYDNIGGLLSAAKSFGAKGVISIRKMSNAKHDCRVPLFIITPEEHEYLSERLNHRYAFKGEQGCLLDEKNIHISSAVSRNLPFTWPIRPDILAPSDAIMAPSPINKKNYVQLNDISAAVAYAAGSIALLVEAHRPINLGYKEIRDMFQNGARPLKDPTLDSYISAEYQGAGLMNLAKAAWPTIGVMPSVVDLSEASPQDKNKPIQLYIINLIGLHEYSISWKPANALLKCGAQVHTINPYSASILVTTKIPSRVKANPNGAIAVDIYIHVKALIPSGCRLNYSGYIVVDRYPLDVEKYSDAATFIPYYNIITN